MESPPTRFISPSDIAYAKLTLHAVKYACLPVFGYLVGTVSEGVAKVDDVVPCFHSAICTPLLISATQIVSNSANIIGVYFVNEREDDKSIPVAVDRVFSTIEARCAGAVCLTLVNDRLKNPLDHALEGLAREKNGSLEKNVELVGDLKSAMQLASNAVDRKLFDSLYDFDDHFDDVSKDPFNKGVSGVLGKL